MLKNLSLTFLLAIVFILKPFACGNYYFAVDKEGNLISMGDTWLYPFNKNFNLERNVKRLAKIEKKLKAEKSYMLLSDYSLCLMKLGKSKEALEILTELYRHYPGEYQVAANLGTAYELNGEVDSALKYIRRGLQLNPHDHEGSEWIHVKVLEVKNELKKNPAYLDDHRVLQLSEKQKNDSTVLEHLSIQLQERVPFTPAPDPILADLFIDMGDISANINSIEYARAYYQIAKNYYGSTVASLDEKIKKLEKLMNKYSAIDPSSYPLKEGEHFREGTANRVGRFKYQELLVDNDLTHYKIDWQKINTDVVALLAMADLTQAPEALKKTAAAASNIPGEEMTLIAEHTDTIAKAMEEAMQVTEDQKETGKNFTWIYVVSCLILLGFGYFIIGKTKK